MLWMSLRFPELSLESLTQAQPPRPGLAFALSELEGRREFVVAVNQEARRRGVRPGQSLSAARAICSELEVRPHEARREQARLEALAGVLHRFSPDICLDRLGSGSALLIEVSRTWNHFGGPEAFLAELGRFLKQLGHEHGIVISPRAAASSLLSRILAGPTLIRDEETLDRELDHAAWQILEPESEAIATLQILGIRNLGELRALPRAGLALRFPAPFVAMLALAYGETSTDLRRFKPARRFRQKLEWWPATSSHSSLLFAAKRLFDLAESWLEGRGQGLLAGRLKLLPADRREAITTLHLRPRRALSDARSLLRLLATKIENLELTTEIDGLELGIDAERNLMPRQGLLFCEDQELCWTQEALELLDRLSSRLGDDAVVSAQLRADHRPEQAYSWQPAGLLEHDAKAATRGAPGKRPLELAERARRIEIETDSWGLPRSILGAEDRGAIQVLSGPERLASGWWTGEDLIRDYFMIETARGRRLWIYQDAILGFWFCHGAFS